MCVRVWQNCQAETGIWETLTLRSVTARVCFSFLHPSFQDSSYDHFFKNYRFVVRHIPWPLALL